MRSNFNALHQAGQKKTRSCQTYHIDLYLLLSLLALACAGLFILYSASNQNWHTIEKQSIRLMLAFIVMIALAQVPPNRYQQWGPWIYALGFFLLLCVLIFGHYDHGAKRWLNLYLFKFQPSELMKLGMPMMLAFFLDDKPLPPSNKVLLIACTLLFLPVLLIAKEPDLGTAIVICCTGIFILLLSGIKRRFIIGVIIALLCSGPFIWHNMHPYQKQRVLTFLNPARDPLGTGYHIIQSKIAIGSGGLWGKGFLQGTQSRLHFLPTHTTDFIFAVSGEELGFMGSLAIVALFLLILARSLYISLKAQTTYARLLSGSLSFTFFLSAFINIGMVTGILPVVGIPLPLISYGGTSMVTSLAGFGILMSIHTHKKLWSR